MIKYPLSSKDYPYLVWYCFKWQLGAGSVLCHTGGRHVSEAVSAANPVRCVTISGKALLIEVNIIIT